MELGVAILALGTLSIGLLVPYLSIRGLQKLKEEGAPKSALSRDGVKERIGVRN